MLVIEREASGQPIEYFKIKVRSTGAQQHLLPWKAQAVCLGLALAVLTYVALSGGGSLLVQLDSID